MKVWVNKLRSKAYDTKEKAIADLVKQRENAIAYFADRSRDVKISPIEIDHKIIYFKTGCTILNSFKRIEVT
jgi:hypothetical protein